MFIYCRVGDRGGVAWCGASGHRIVQNLVVSLIDCREKQERGFQWLWLVKRVSNGHIGDREGVDAVYDLRALNLPMLAYLYELVASSIFGHVVG
mmetsp:Transcript_83980/g.218621  ORF Transcript_83980/g.218621 Transcript_83980/m.218621 type:complete len:94 (-) Transcript_83980:74-355(-)